MTDNKIRQQFTTPIFMLSYPHLDKMTTPSAMYPDSTPKYEITMIFNAKTKELDKKWGSGESVEAMAKIQKDMTIQLHGEKEEGGWPEVWRVPLKNGATKKKKKDADLYKDGFFMKATNLSKVQCLDAAKAVLDVSDRTKCYGGMYARAIVTFASYADGIGCYLDAFQKIEDGEPLGAGAVNAVEAFADLSAEPAKAVSDLDLL